MNYRQIIEQVPIVDVISKYCTLKRAGQKEVRTVCPFHPDSDPSLYVNPTKNVWHCHGCGRGGNVITFVSEIERIPYRDAALQLAEQYDIQIVDMFDFFRAERQCLIAAKIFYSRMLHARLATCVMDYILKRGIRPDIVEKFELGYSPEQIGIKKYLHKHNMSWQVAENVGLLSNNREVLRGRIIFPIYHQGQLVSFAGRKVRGNGPKYLNLRNTEIFDRNSVLYGMNRAYGSFRKSGEIYIVEGQMDVLAMHSIGIENTVGLMGTSFSAERAAQLSGAKKTTIVLDADQASSNRLREIVCTLEDYNLNPHIVLLPSGDPAENVLKDSGRFLRMLYNASPGFLHLLHTAKNAEDMSRLLARIRNRLRRSEWVRVAANIMGGGEHMESVLEAGALRFSAGEEWIETTETNGREELERRVLGSVSRDFRLRKKLIGALPLYKGKRTLRFFTNPKLAKAVIMGGEALDIYSANFPADLERLRVLMERDSKAAELDEWAASD